MSWGNSPPQHRHVATVLPYWVIPAERPRMMRLSIARPRTYRRLVVSVVLVSSAIGAAWFVTGSAQAQTVTGEGAAHGERSSTGLTPGTGHGGKGDNGGRKPHPLFSITGGASGL